MPESAHGHEINVRATRYYVLSTHAVCLRCGVMTRLVALALPPGHEMLEGDDAGTWEVADHGACVFHLEHLSPAVQCRMRDIVPSFRPDEGSFDTGPVWANHCEHCDEPWDDHDLFCEPGGAFLPEDEVRAALIDVTPVDGPFEAFAAGYDQEPWFLDTGSDEP